MKFLAYEFLFALYAGLELSGKAEGNVPEWIGKDAQWNEYKRLVTNYRKHQNE